MAKSQQNISDRPNIVLILADDMGYSDLGCYGSEISTPNLDGLADQGVRFTHFYNMAECIATRASLLTGQYGEKVGLKKWGGELQSGRNNVTFAELLKDAGYRTLMSGKWDNGYRSGERPVDRGFERYWGLLSGASNYFNPGEKRPGEPKPVHKSAGNMRRFGDDDKVMFPFTPKDPDFYATDAFTDRALGFLDLYGKEDRPFLLYLSYTAPHYPMQARPEDIARYQGRYMMGWDELRRRRYAGLLEAGIVDPTWGVSDRDRVCPAWEDVVDKERWDRKMAVYAAMVECMDRGIGKVLDKIRELGKEENTLLLFLSDNGGCSEHYDNTPDLMPGPVNTYTTVDAPWANASNAPFRKFKKYDHEGGIATPLIASWPEVISPGSLTHQLGNVMDFLPTFAELAQADYPAHYNGHSILPADGKSLVPVFRGEEREMNDALFWEHAGCRAVRKGRWKAVSQGPERRHVGHDIPPGSDGWELYDIETDRCELEDVSGKHPEVIKELDGLWKTWFENCRKEKEAAM